jgi:hypothetical protein
MEHNGAFVSPTGATAMAASMVVAVNGSEWLQWVEPCRSI